MARSESPTISVSRRGSTRGAPDCTVVWVRGELDIESKASLAATVARAAQLDDLPILVDLSGVTFMDASVVGAIVGSRDQLRSRGQSLEVRAPSPTARSVLELCGLAHLIQQEAVHPTGPAAALATWVDVPPMAPAESIDHEAGHVMERPATVEADRGGP
jgi:anti-anti-sigma factor